MSGRAQLRWLWGVCTIAVQVLAEVPDKVYWTDLTNDRIYRATAEDGSDVELVVEHPSLRPLGVAVHEDDCALYVGSGSLSSRYIYRISLDGGVVSQFVSITESAHATGLQLDTESQLLYWIQTDSRIKRTSVDRTSDSYGVVEELSHPLSGQVKEWLGLAVDVRTAPETLYISELYDGVAWMHEWAGSLEEFFADWAVMYKPVDLALDTKRDRLLFSDSDSSWVGAIDLATRAYLGTIAKDLVYPSGIQVSEDYLYLLEEGQSSSSAQPRLSRHSLAGGAGNWTVAVQGKPQRLALMNATRTQAAMCFTTTTTATTTSSTSTRTRTSSTVTATSTSSTATTSLTSRTTTTTTTTTETTSSSTSLTATTSTRTTTSVTRTSTTTSTTTTSTTTTSTTTATVTSLTSTTSTMTSTTTTTTTTSLTTSTSSSETATSTSSSTGTSTTSTTETSTASTSLSTSTTSFTRTSSTSTTTATTRPATTTTGTRTWTTSSTTSTTPPRNTTDVSGTVVFTADGVDEAQVVDAVGETVAASLAVPRSQVQVTVSCAGACRRLAAGAWVVRYKVSVPPASGGDVVVAVQRNVASPEAFATQLASALVLRGAVAGSVELRALSPPAVAAAAVPPGGDACGADYCPAGWTKKTALLDDYCSSVPCETASESCCTVTQPSLPALPAETTSAAGIAIPIAATFAGLCLCGLVAALLQRLRVKLQDAALAPEPGPQELLHPVVPRQGGGASVSPEGVQVRLAPERPSSSVVTPKGARESPAHGLLFEDEDLEGDDLPALAGTAAAASSSAPPSAAAQQAALALRPAVGEWRLLQDGAAAPGCIVVEEDGRASYDGVHFAEQDLAAQGGAIIRQDGWALAAVGSDGRELLWCKRGEKGIVWHKVRDVADYSLGSKVEAVVSDVGVPPGTEGRVVHASDGRLAVTFGGAATAVQPHQVVSMEELGQHRRGERILASLVGDWRLYDGAALLPGAVSIGPRGRAVYDGRHWPEQDLLLFGGRLVRSDGWAVDMQNSTEELLLWGMEGHGTVTWKRVKVAEEYCAGDLLELLAEQGAVAAGRRGQVLGVVDGRMQVKFDDVSLELGALDVVPIEVKVVQLPSLAAMLAPPQDGAPVPQPAEGGPPEAPEASPPSPPRTPERRVEADPGALPTPPRETLALGDAPPQRRPPGIEVEADVGMDGLAPDPMPPSTAPFSEGRLGSAPASSAAGRASPGAASETSMVFSSSAEHPVLHQQVITPVGSLTPGSATALSPPRTPQPLSGAGEACSPARSASSGEPRPPATYDEDVRGVPPSPAADAGVRGVPPSPAAGADARGAPPGALEADALGTASNLSWLGLGVLQAVSGPIHSGMSSFSAMLRRAQDSPAGGEPQPMPELRSPVSATSSLQSAASGLATPRRDGRGGAMETLHEESPAPTPAARPSTRDRRQILV